MNDKVDSIVLPPPCPQCQASPGVLGGLTLACRGTRNRQGWLPVAVVCMTCGLEGPTRSIRYANRTRAPWEAFRRQNNAVRSEMPAAEGDAKHE